MSRKRAQDSSEHGGGSAKRVARASETIFRLLIPATKIGKVIGKQGVQIRQLREETSARIKIADTVSNVEDRVVIITSREDAGSSRTAAEDALLRLALMVMEEHVEGTATASIGAQHHVAPNVTRLLIAGSQAGCLIGKGGSTIKEIRENSGANVRVMPPDLLPVCSASLESDRLVQVSGEMPQVQQALEIIAAKLRENPCRESFTRSSFYQGVGGLQQQLLIPQGGMALYAIQQTSPPSRHSQAYGMLQPPSLASSTVLSSHHKISTEMTVASALMGGVIGRGGCNISQIRTLSGATVKVSGQKEGSAERSITIEGTAQQVQAAQGLVHAYLSVQ